MSIITTGINVVARGVNTASRQIEAFGNKINGVNVQLRQFAYDYERNMRRLDRQAGIISRALNKNWANEYQMMLRTMEGNTAKTITNLEKQYDRFFRQIGRRYESLIMGSVALSMSGISLRNWGTDILRGMKSVLDHAREWEVIERQILFYSGNYTKNLYEQEKVISKIRTEIFKLGRELPVTTFEIGNAAIGAFKLGYETIDEAVKMAEESSKLQFMSLGKLDGEESIKFLNLLRKYTGYAVKDVGKLNDKIIKTADLSAADPESLFRTLMSTRTAFDNLKTDEDTFFTLMGVMSDRLQPRQAGMALSSFARGVQMAEKAGRENRGTRGQYYNQLIKAMGGNFDSYDGDILAYIQDVATYSKKLWGDGSERIGNLISIFGVSAIDLFHAVDAYNELTGRTMTEMRDAIAKSDGYAEDYIELLMQTSYGTEMILKAIAEQFQILFGLTFRKGFNKLLQGISWVLTKINEFIEKHPLIAKVLGYGTGIAGLFLVATGAAMLFSGGLMAIYASLSNMVIQMARNTRVLELLNTGYSTAGQMIRGQLLKPLRWGIGLFARMTLLTGILAIAWKQDFFGMRTSVTNWYKETEKSFKLVQKLIEGMDTMNPSTWAYWYDVVEHNLTGLAKTYLKAYGIVRGLGELWDKEHQKIYGRQLSYGTKKQLDALGVTDIVYKIDDLRQGIEAFWKGFTNGLEEGLEFFLDITKPLRTLWNWISDIIKNILQNLGYFQTDVDTITNKWEKWGTSIGQLLGQVLAIRFGIWTWAKAFAMVFTPARKLFNILKKIWDFFKDKPGGKIGRGAGGLLARMLVPAPIREKFGVAKQTREERKRERMIGAHSVIPGARRTPTGQVTYGSFGPKPKYKNIRDKEHLREIRQQRKEWRRNERNLRKLRRSTGYVIPDPTGRTSGRLQRRGIRARIGDFLYGRPYAPERFTDSRGSVRTRVRTGTGTVFTDATGRTKRGYIRTGEGLIPRLKRTRIVQASMVMGEVIKKTRGRTGITPMSTITQQDVQQARQKVKQKTQGPVYAPAFFGGVGGGQSKKGGILGAVGKGAKGITKTGTKIGGGLLKGIGKVITKGIPGIFKMAFRAIPILGWALMAWDIISIIWGNWGPISKGAKKLWDKVIEWGSSAWDSIVEKATAALDWLKDDGAEKIKEGIKEGASIAWEWVKLYGGMVWEWFKTTAIPAMWEAFKLFGGIAWEGIKILGSLTWDAIKAFGLWAWEGIKTGAGLVWDWIKEKAGGIWNSITTFASTSWEWVKNKASNIWEAIKTKAGGVWDWARNKAGMIWDWIRNKAYNIWENIRTKASTVWDWVRNKASTIWNSIRSKAYEIWNNVRTKASTIWDSIKSYARKMWDSVWNKAVGIWNSIKRYASTKINEIKGVAQGIFDGLFSKFTTIWNNIKNFASRNPITQKIRTVTEKITAKFSRTGEWYVPRDNMPYMLHQGEMVLPRAEAQILRNMVGAPYNSIARTLLERDKDNSPNISVVPKQTTQPQLKVVKTQQKIETGGEPREHKTEINFTENSIRIEVQNATPQEIKEGARLMFEEFKRMVERENIRHYRPARPYSY